MRLKKSIPPALNYSCFHHQTLKKNNTIQATACVRCDKGKISWLFFEAESHAMTWVVDTPARLIASTNGCGVNPWVAAVFFVPRKKKPAGRNVETSSLSKFLSSSISGLQTNRFPPKKNWSKVSKKISQKLKSISSNGGGQSLWSPNFEIPLVPWLKVVIFLECSSGLPAHHGPWYIQCSNFCPSKMVGMIFYSPIQPIHGAVASVPPWKVHIQNGRGHRSDPLPKRKNLQKVTVDPVISSASRCTCHLGAQKSWNLLNCSYSFNDLETTMNWHSGKPEEKFCTSKILYRKFIHTLKRMFKSPSRSLVLVHFQWPKAALVSRQVAAEKLNNSNIMSILRIFLMVSTNPFFSKILQARQILPNHLRLPTNSSLRWPVLSPVTGKQLWGFNGEVSTATFWVNTVSN